MAELIPEICCDYCGDVIHNHIDECPKCKTRYASTSAYGQLEAGEIFECDNCQQQFKYISWDKIETLEL